MEKIEIDTFFGEKLAHIEISAPMGAGNSYYVNDRQILQWLTDKNYQLWLANTFTPKYNTARISHNPSD